MQLPIITGRTRLLGILADPVAQARSPGMANTLLQERGLFGEYVLVPLHATASSLVNVLEGLRHLQNFAGAIVSMPHKSAVLPILDELLAEARLVGAVNVIRREVGSVGKRDDQKEKLPNLSYPLFENSGHTPQLEEPALFNQKLTEWMENGA